MSELESLLGAPLDDRIGADVPIARGLPRAAYIDKALLDLEWRAWLARTWLFVGLAREVPEPGDLAPVPFLRIFLARGRDGEVRAFHNVCRHRGHELVRELKPGAKAIVCPYHGWRYDLTGELRATSVFAGPEGGLAPGFDPADYGLKPVRLARWHDWLFVNLDGAAPPLDEHLAPLTCRLSHVDLSDLHSFQDLEHGEVAANWKLIMENSLEPYHTPFVHARTGAGIPLEDHYMVREAGLLGCGIEVGDSGAGVVDGGVAADSQFLVVPPMLVFVLYANRIVIVHRNLPSLERPDRTWRSVHLYSLGAPLPEREVADWKEVERVIHVEEDGPVYESLQRNKASLASDDGGVLSPVWETTVLDFYRLWAERLNATE